MTDWNLDPFNDGEAEQLATKKTIDRYEQFVKEYRKNVEETTNILEQSLTDSYDTKQRPLLLQLEPYESLSIFELASSTNHKILGKIIAALGSICSEIDSLKFEATKYYSAIILYGESIPEVTYEDGDGQKKMGEFFGVVQEINGFVTRVYAVIRNVVHQLGALYPNKKKSTINFDASKIQFTSVFESLADALQILVTLDYLIESNDYLLEHWKLYRTMITFIQKNPTKFNADEQKLRQFEKLLQNIEGTILDGNIFSNSMQQSFDHEELMVTRNQNLINAFNTNLETHFFYLDARIGQPNETDQRYRFVGFCALLAFFSTLFSVPIPVDKKFFKSVFMTYKKIPVVLLFGNIYFSPPEFFISHMEQAVKQIGRIDYKKDMMAILKKSDDLMADNSQELYCQVSVWMARFFSELAPASKDRELLNTRLALLLQGLLYARNISNVIHENIGLHLYLQTPLSKKNVVPLCKLIENLKAVEDAFEQQIILLGDSLPYIVEYLTFCMHNILKSGRDRFTGGNHSDDYLDAIAALTLAINCLNGPGSKNRHIVFDIAFAISQKIRFLKDEEIEEANNIARRLEAIITLQKRVYASCDCQFLFWNRSLLANYFADKFSRPQFAHGLQYMLWALRDTRSLLKMGAVDSQTLMKNFENEIIEMVQENIIKPLCETIEKDLRLLTHSHLKLDDRNPFKVGLRDYSVFLQIMPLRLFDRYIDIKSHVAHYLDRTFYNLTTVALHDWKTYAEMRNLALEKYGIEMAEVHLPSGTIEQGIDALVIMRNIHVFARSYNYNINHQVFVEKTSNNKHLNTINIRHIANSIRTHGTGVMNTTVNVTYQFLRKQFVTFSEFLYDDHIKSRLIKDVRFFRDNREQLKNRYPFERAESFNKNIRKLGTQGEMSYLDQFRILITTIGNAMGYIRMVRSGGLHYCSNAINFVPDIRDILQLESLVQEEGLSATAVEATKLLDDAIENLSKNFSDSTDYLQLLVTVFATQFRDPKNAHLRNFHIIIPPLTVNYVEYLLNAKSQIDKKRNEGATFTDDGFAMGVAYILKLLDQNETFDSLHWFSSVFEHYMNESNKLDEASRKKGKAEEQQSILLNKKKINTYRREYELLNYSLTGARIFFREEGEHFAEATKAENTASQDNSDAVSIAPSQNEAS